MPVRFRCPNDKCNTALSVAARKAGSVVTCPKCGQPVIVPTPPAAVADAALTNGKVVAL